MTVTAHMRNGVTGTETPLDIDPEVTNAVAVHVPGFGIMLCGPAKTDEAILRLGPPAWLAVLVQPDDRGEFSKRSNHVRREGVVAGKAVEYELLPNASGEDRLVVVVEGMIEENPSAL